MTRALRILLYYAIAFAIWLCANVLGMLVGVLAAAPLSVWPPLTWIVPGAFVGLFQGVYVRALGVPAARRWTVATLIGIAIATFGAFALGSTPLMGADEFYRFVDIVEQGRTAATVLGFFWIGFLVGTVVGTAQALALRCFVSDACLWIWILVSAVALAVGAAMYAHAITRTTNFYLGGGGTYSLMEGGGLTLLLDQMFVVVQVFTPAVAAITGIPLIWVLRRARPAGKMDDTLAASRRWSALATGMTMGLLTIAVLGFVNVQAWSNLQRDRALDAAAAQEAEVARIARATQAAVEDMALPVVAAMPAALRPLYDRFGLAFVPVPAGEFTMGRPAGQGMDDEHPQHVVSLSSYWIGLTEVTNAQYRPFVVAGGDEPHCWNDSAFNQPVQPVVCIAWDDAVAYADWLSSETGLEVRLPTEAEWEKAARGSDGRTYPWGEQPPGSRLANLRGEEDGFEYTAPVGSYPAGASPFGAQDMAGNVFEWTSTLYADYPYAAGDGREALENEQCCRVARGGSWFEAAHAPAATRVAVDHRNWSSYQGFRLIVVTPQYGTGSP